MSSSDEQQAKPDAFVLVGLPGSGKSHWANNHPDKLPVASTDKYIESYAEQNGLSYEVAFKAHFPQACDEMAAEIEGYKKAGREFIWDQVNLVPEERTAIYKDLSPTHCVVFVCFLVPLEECIRRHKERARDGGKVVDEDRIRMLAKKCRFPDPRGAEPYDGILPVRHPDWGRKAG